MSIDTSSYYPEVPDQDGNNNPYSLNHRKGGLFDVVPETTPESADELAEGNQEPTPEPENESGDTKIPETPGEHVLTVISHFLSWVLSPLLMPVYGLILAFTLSILEVAPTGMRVTFTLITGAICSLLPMMLIVVLKMCGIIQDVALNGRKERLIPYLLTALCFAGGGWFLSSKGAPLWLTLFFAGGALATFINTIINFWWKISAHAAGIAGVVALLIRIEKDGSPQPELMGWLIATIILAGMLGSARVWLGRHTVWQVLAGLTVGFCSVFFLTMIK